MRIAYVSHYRDGTGYGNAAANYIECLDSIGIEVVAIPFRLSKNNYEPSNIIKKCEMRKLSGVELIVLHTLPSFFDKHSYIPTLGVFSTEMSGIPQNWVDNANYLAGNVVSSDQSLECCVNSGVTKPISVIPYCFNLDKFMNYGKLDTIEEIKKEGTKIFYTIGEFINRKNFSAILRAYYAEFTNKDNVHLVIKTNLSGKSPQEIIELFKGKNYEIIRGMNIDKDNLAPVTILPYYMPEEDIHSLHNSCDIYVSASYGESFDLCAFTAMAFGKTPIVPDYYKCIRYMSEKEGFMVKSYQLPCFGLVDGDPTLYNSHFNFNSVDINDLRKQMRLACSSENLHSKSMSGIEKSKLFSYDNIGPIFQEVLKSVKKD